MAKSVLVFFPHNPYPPRSGAHQRCLEVLGALRELGCDVTLCSSALVSDNPWAPASAEYLRRHLVARVAVHTPSPLDYAYAGAIVLPHRLVGRPLAVDSRAYCPPGLRRLFGRLLAELDPRAVVVSYPFYDRLLDHAAHRHRLRVIDSIDLSSANVAMWAAVAKHIPLRPVR